MIICVWILGLVLAFINIKYEKKIIIFFEILIIILIMSCNNMATDEMNLYHGFLQMQAGTYKMYDITSWLYTNGLMQTAADWGLSYGVFDFITISIAFILINQSLKHINCNRSVVYLCYMITSIFLDTTLIRQFLAFAFVMYGWQFLLGDIIDKKKYVIFVLVGAVMHFSMLAFLIFIIDFDKIDFKTQKILFFNVSFLCLIIVLLNNKQIPGLSFILSIFGSDKLISYSYSTMVRNGWMYSCLVWLSMMTLSTYISMNRVPGMPFRDYQIIRKLDIMVTLSMFFIMFSMITMVYSRLFRPVSWLVFVELAYLPHSKKKGITKRRLIILILAAGFVFIYSFIFNHIIFDYGQIKAVLRGAPFWRNIM